MAQRQRIDNSFNQVAMPDSSYKADIANTVAQTASVLIQTKQKQDELKMSNFGAQAEVELLQTTNQWRIDNSDKPDDMNARQELNKSYDAIFAKYDDKLGIGSLGQWKQRRDLYKSQYAKNNATWVMAQNVKNAENNLNESKTTILNLAYELGKGGDQANALQTYEIQNETLRNGLQGLLPQDQIDEKLKDFKEDFMKEYIMGTVQRSPEKAIELLNDKKVVEAIGRSEVIDDIHKGIAVQQKEIEIRTLSNHLTNQSDFEENTANMDFTAQLKDLEQGIVDNRYDSKWAKSKKEALLSSKGIDATTQEDKYADFALQLDDITERYLTNQIKYAEYAKETNQLGAEVNYSESNGEINAKDAKIIMRKLFDKDSKRMEAGITEESRKRPKKRFTTRKASNLFKQTLTGKAYSMAVKDFFIHTADDSYKDIKDSAGNNLKSPEQYAQYLSDNANQDKREAILSALSGAKDIEGLINKSESSKSIYLKQVIRQDKNGNKALVGIKEDGSVELIREL